jgi:hypothetical protein
MKSQTRRWNETEVSFYLRLLDALYKDVASAYPAKVQVECLRDWMEIQKRTYAEGLSFLTKTLPSLAKAIDIALATDTPLQTHGFSLIRKTKIPKFLGWLLKEVFHLDGAAKAPSLDASLAFRSLRQILYLFYKLELPHDPKTIQKILSSFINTEKEMETFPSLSPDQMRIVRSASRLVHAVVQENDPRDIIPKHGPGAVATGEKPWEKPHFKRFYPDLNECYPYYSHMYFNPTHFICERVSGACDELQSVTAPPLSKAVAVPKDSRGPRLISMEPLELQWIQQGLKDVLVEAIEKHKYTRGRVNFRDQTVNQRLALESSETGTMVSLDMKDASDRVSLALVQMLFPSDWVECLEACRSHGTILPDGKEVLFNKFAPMGSALCFPVEALVFWSLSVATIMDNRRITAWQAAKHVYVYGDDIIVPKEDYLGIITSLESVGLLFNAQKCCTGTSFRESCGVDAYKGIIVTPLRVKPRWMHRSLPAQTHASYVELSNHFYERGYIHTAHFIENEVQAKHRTAYTAGPASAIQFVRSNLNVRLENHARGLRIRHSRRIHAPVVWSRRIRSTNVKVSNGYRGLLDHWCRRYRHEQLEGPLQSILKTKGSPRQTEQYSQPRRVSSKWGWATTIL